jgi:hydrophobe/amphiphile efflux-1 (HAE1) family protein
LFKATQASQRYAAQGTYDSFLPWLRGVPGAMMRVRRAGREFEPVKFAHFFIDRPVFASVISIVTIICGALAIRVMPVAQYPEIVPPTVVVTANYPGANAQTVADTIAAPIEQQINGVENMLYMSSQSTNDGQLNLTVTFRLGTNLDDAQVQVQNRVAIAEPTLPEDVRRLGVTVKKRSPDITLAVQFYSPKDPATGKPERDTLYISNFATQKVRDKIARLEGVGDVFLFGARDYSMRLWLDPQKLASLNMTAGDVVKAVREQNIQVAAGVVGQQPLPADIHVAQQLTVNAQGRLTTKEQFEQIVVKTGDNGAILRLKDVARVELGAKDYSLRVYAGKSGDAAGDESIGMPVFQLPGSNAIDTANAVARAMKELRASPEWPSGVEYQIPFDTTTFVRQSMKDVVKTLAEAVGLVVLVVIIFLQNWRAAVIPLAAVPVSLIGTCAVMWPLGFSLNNLSLFGLVLAIGIVVDDAIVVVENVERWMERGLPARQATYEAMREVTPAVLAVAAGLSAVFIPTAFISGITGQFYRQFALTIAVSTLISAFNSLTLSPALAAILLRPHHEKPDLLERIIEIPLGWFFKLFNRGFDLTVRAYVGVLKWVVRLSAVALLAYAGLLLATVFMFRTVPTGFIPQQDKGYLLCVLQMPDATSLDKTTETMKRMEEIGRKTPGVKFTFAVTGFSVLSGTNQSNAGVMFVSLKDFDERAGHPQQSLQGILGHLMGQFSQIQDGFALVFPPPAVQGMGNAGGYKIQIQDFGGHTPQDLQAVSEQFVMAAMQQDAASGHPKLQTMLPSFRANVPQLWANVNREKVKQQGVDVTDVFNTLQTYLGSLYVNDFNLNGRTYQVTAQADAKFRATGSDVANLKTRNSQGEMVPLGAVMDIKDITGPVRIARYNLFPAADINLTSMPGAASGDVIKFVEDTANATLPAGFGYEWTELALQERLAGNSALWIFPMCVLFVFLVHAAEYESWSLPTAIILIVPMCLLSGIIGVFLRGMDNNIFTQIGFVVLAGLSAKNAVLIVEFAKQQEEHNPDIGYVKAAIEAARLRLRPILMTSFAFILGVVPLVVASGAGFEMRQALGTAVFSGMLGVTFFGIFLTPVFYVTIRWITTTLRPNSRLPGHHYDAAPHGNGDGGAQEAQPVPVARATENQPAPPYDHR